MNSMQTPTPAENPARHWLVPGAIAAISLVICAALAVGWTVQARRLKTAGDGLAAANETLQRDAADLQNRLTALNDRSSQTIDELMAMNRTLADANEKFATEVTGIRKTLEAATTENLKLVDQVTRLHDDARRQTAESAKQIADLTAGVMRLTEDLAAANARLDSLVTQLQAKTDEAAEQAIRINTLVEMVARLRLLVGQTGERPAAPAVERPADPNAAVTKPPA